MIAPSHLTARITLGDKAQVSQKAMGNLLDPLGSIGSTVRINIDAHAASGARQPISIVR
jgi:hypothetical protein